MASQAMKMRRLTLLVMVAVLSIAGVRAQDEPSRSLVPGQAISGSLGSDAVAQVYTFTGTAGQEVGLTATGEGALALVLTDAAGTAVAQVVGTAGDGAALENITLPGDGTYYVTVVSAEGVSPDGSVFELTLDTVAAPSAVFTPPGELLTATGLQVELSWDSVANLDMEVRDPVGGSLFFNTPTVESGGRFDVNVNSVCANLVESPTERAAWPSGVIPTGSYEVLVYYQPLDNCPTSEPVTFRINATVDSAPVPEFQGTLLPGQVYIAVFVVGVDGSVQPGLSGIKPDFTLVSSLPVAPAQLQEEAVGQLILPDVPVQGVITSAQPYQVFSFSGEANQVVSVSMTANSGSLDTLVLLLDPNGNIVGSSDDIASGITDSAIVNQTLILDGQYTVVATRYGQRIGGTEGGYQLTLTGTVGVDQAALPQLPDLPAGAVEVSLQWSTGADIQLLVRDPQGSAVFDDSPVIASGGRLAADGNVNCRASDGSPVSYIYWPEGRLPTAGPYEVEVWYQNQCNDNRPVVFVLNVVANESVVISVTQPLLPNERYLISFVIDVSGQIVAGEGGVFGTSQRPDVGSLDFGPLVPDARVLTSDEQVTGSIRLNQKFDVYVFEGQAGQLATISMEGLSGTLDPVVFLIDPNGVQVAQNDDASRETTNSLISDFTLSEDGQYIIIATHFGARYGVTVGDYRLTLRLN